MLTGSGEDGADEEPEPEPEPQPQQPVGVSQSMSRLRYSQQSFDSAGTGVFTPSSSGGELSACGYSDDDSPGQMKTNMTRRTSSGTDIHYISFWEGHGGGHLIREDSYQFAGTRRREQAKAERDMVWKALTAVTDEEVRSNATREKVLSGLARFVHPNELKRLSYEEYLQDVPLAVRKQKKPADAARAKKTGARGAAPRKPAEKRRASDEGGEGPDPESEEASSIRMALMAVCDELGEEALAETTPKVLRRKIEDLLKKDEGDLDEWKKLIREWYELGESIKVALRTFLQELDEDAEVHEGRDGRCQTDNGGAQLLLYVVDRITADAAAAAGGGGGVWYV